MRLFKIQHLRLLNNKKFRLYVGLFSIVQGVARIDIVPYIPSNNVSFLTNDIFGWLFLIFGMLSVITTFTRHRRLWLGRISVAMLAAIYSALGVAILQSSTTSAIGSFLITIFLFVEAGIVNEC